MKFDRNQHKSLPPSLSLSRDRDYLIAWSKRKSSPRNHCHRVGKSVASGVPYGIGYEVSIPELRLVRISPASLTCRPISFLLFPFLFSQQLLFLRNRLYDVVIGRPVTWTKGFIVFPNHERYIYTRCILHGKVGDFTQMEKIRSKISWIKFSLCERVEEK